MRAHVAVALACALLPFTAPSARAQAIDLVGSWRGTSTCADKVSHPGCNNEVVIYDVLRKGSAKDTVNVRTDKVVNGAREFMGEFDFHRAADSSWVSVFENPRTKLKIVLRVRGTHLTGTVTDEIGGTRVRDLALDRVTP